MTVLIILASVFLNMAWIAVCSWMCRTPELAKRNGPTLGWLGTVLGLTCGIGGAVVGVLSCTM